MATKIVPILGFSALPDNSGNVYFEPASSSLEATGRYPRLVGVFTDTATKISAGFSFRVPKDYVGSPKVYFVWATPATSGAVVWALDYTAVAAGETVDPSGDQESLSVTSNVPGTARLRKDESVTLTASNLSPDDLVLGKISRDGTSGSDTLASSAYLLGAFFEYSDV